MKIGGVLESGIKNRLYPVLKKIEKEVILNVDSDLRQQCSNIKVKSNGFSLMFSIHMDISSNFYQIIKNKRK